jgi:hypothetical protein
MGATMAPLLNGGWFLSIFRFPLSQFILVIETAPRPAAR